MDEISAKFPTLRLIYLLAVVLYLIVKKYIKVNISCLKGSMRITQLEACLARCLKQMGHTSA